MPRFRTWTPAIEAGELAPEYKFRTDAPVRNRGLLKARNVRLLSGGGWERRWGTRRKVEHAGAVRYETIGIGESDALLFAFGPGRLDIYRSDWTVAQSITAGCPWTTADLDTMQVAAEQNRVTVTSRLFYPYEIVRATSSSPWSVVPKTFSPGQNGALLQPYYRFHAPGTALIPSALTGAITLTTTAPHFTAAHVNTRVRYQGVEIVIDNFTSPTEVKGQVLGSLYPTLTVPVDSIGGFLVGDVVEGSESKVRGVVVAVGTTTLTVLLTDGYEYFQSSPAEKLIGPNNRVTLTGAPTLAPPAGAADWDEQLISTARGFPGACGYHRGRQILADFPAAPNLICASSPGDPDDYDVGEGGPADAIVETVARDDTLRIRFIASMEQLLVFTEAGSYYVPETVGAPFSPTNAEFLKIGPEAIGDAAPVQVSEGMLFAEARSGRLLIALPTGQVRRSWEIADLSELSYHLMGTPKKLAVLPATARSDREIVVLKDDGTIAWMRYRRGQEVAGWCPWDTQGAWRTIAVVDGRLMLGAERNVGGVKVWGEELDPLATLDGCALSADGIWPHLPGAAVSVTKERQAIWTGTLSGSGAAPSESWWGGVDGGFAYTVAVEYPPPIDGESGQWRPMQIIRAFVTVRASGTFRVAGRQMAIFEAEAAEDAWPSLFTGVREEWVSGIAFDRTLTISQDTAGPLTVEAVTMEVKS